MCVDLDQLLVSVIMSCETDCELDNNKNFIDEFLLVPIQSGGIRYSICESLS